MVAHQSCVSIFQAHISPSLSPGFHLAVLKAGTSQGSGVLQAEFLNSSSAGHLAFLIACPAWGGFSMAVLQLQGTATGECDRKFL